MRRLPISFYERDTARVAQDLLGKVLIHRSPEGTTRGRIVETEAYYGRRDPASRAYRRRTKLNELMWWRGGLAFVYMVHARWMFNVTAERENIPGAVLIRALAPLGGIELMQRRRQISDETELMSGPGKLTQAMGITYDHHKTDLTKSRVLTITDAAHLDFRVRRSNRIGVSADLKRKLRFFIEGNRCVSKAKP